MFWLSFIIWSQKNKKEEEVITLILRKCLRHTLQLITSAREIRFQMFNHLLNCTVFLTQLNPPIPKKTNGNDSLRSLIWLSANHSQGEVIKEVIRTLGLRQLVRGWRVNPHLWKKKQNQKKKKTGKQTQKQKQKTPQVINS